MSEEQKRLHRCCFTGHRPEKLRASEEEVRAWLTTQIEKAIAEGYTTFITGMAMGVDIWAGEIVADMRASHPGLHLIAATPYPTFAVRWSPVWRNRYYALIQKADLVKEISTGFNQGAFQKRNEWMVDHSNRVIAYYNGEAGGTQNLLKYASNQGVEIVLSGTEEAPNPQNEETENSPSQT